VFHLLLIPAGKWVLAHWGASALAASHAAPVHAAIATGAGHAAAAGAATHLAAAPAFGSAASAVHGAAASHAAGVLTQHGANTVAKMAGTQAAKVFAGAAAGSHAAAASAVAPHALHVLPVHLVSGAALAKVTAVTAGTAGGVAAVSLSPHASVAAKKLAKAFAKGFVLQQIKRQRTTRIDLREIKKWFGQQDDPETPHLRFTAIGKVRGGRFYPVPAPNHGPYSLMQGVYEPKTGELISGRVVRVADSLSGSVLRSHRPSGVTVYATDSALRAA
jgi:hypothetical protein